MWELLLKRCITIEFDAYYKIIEIIGKGAFATVYRVQCFFDEKIYAAKCYYKDTFLANQNKTRFVEMIRNECEVLRTVEDEGIANVIQVYQDPDKVHLTQIILQVTLVMDIAEGPNLYDVIKKYKRLQEIQASILLYSMCKAMNVVAKQFNNNIHKYRAGYVHRDLKLENIHLSTPNAITTKILDFGFAEKVQKVLLNKQGTPGYLPPELFDNKPYGEKGDVFGIGVVFYCLLSGSSPFKGKTYQEILESNKEANPSFSRSYWENVSEEGKQMLKKMLAKDPNQRPTFEEILNSKWMKNMIKNEQIDKLKSNVSLVFY